MIRLIPILLIVQFTIVSLHAGGPWTPNKHKGIFIGSVSPNIYSAISGQNEGITLNRRVSDITAQLYAEYGITDKLAAVLNLPFKYVQTGSDIRTGGDFADTLPSGQMVFPGNIELELKYKFYQKKKFVMAGGIKGETPIAKYKNATGLRTGYDSWAVVPTVHMGVSFSSRIYAQFMGGFAFRTNDYSDEWRASVEVGYKLKKPFWIALLLQAKQSLNNGNRNDADLDLSNNLHTGLYLNDEQYYAWAFKFSYAINQRLGVNWALAGGITTRYIARTPAFSFGIYYDWHEKRSSRN